MAAPLRRLVVPAPRHPAREHLFTARPWFLRAPASLPAPASPAPAAILTFTRDTFVPAFLEGVAKAEGGAAAFERLIPHRDWAEPPAAVVAASGRAFYPTAGDEAVRRAPPVQAVAEAKTDPGEALDQDGVPSGEPPWLRKLYLGLHRHFQIVVAEWVCHRRDFPRIAKERVLEAGIVVRRLLPDPGAQRWEDWIPGPDEDTGAWLEIADRHMAPLAAPERRLDPSAITDDLPPVAEPAVRLLYDLAEDEGLPADLEIASLPMSALPASVGSAALHTAFFGYLPLQTPELQAGEFDANAVGDLRAALAGRARARLRAAYLADDPDQPASPAAIAAEAEALRQRIAEPLRRLFHLLMLPSASEAAASRANLISAMGALGIGASALDDFADSHLPSLVWSAAPAPASMNTESAADWWEDASAGLSFSGSLAALPAHLEDVLGLAVSARLHDRIETLLQGQSSLDPSERGEALLFLTVLLRRVRSVRRAIAHDFYDRIPELDPAAIDQVSGIGGLSDELDAWLAADTDAARARRPQPWPQVGVDDFPKEVHAAAATLERALREAHERGAFAGTAFGPAVRDAAADGIAALASAVPGGLGTDPEATLRAQGFDFAVPPERGLFGFPGFAPDVAGIEAFVERVAEYYEAPPPFAEEQVKSEGRALTDVVRPRFDADHVYGVWCFARIAGRDPCELERVVWTAPGEPFSIAEPADVLGLRPAPMRLPDLGKLVRDIPRIAKAGAKPFAAVDIPPDSDVQVGEDPTDTRRKWGIAWICSFGIPVFTICAWILFQIIFNILIALPGFAWMLLLRFCIPVPGRK